MKLAIFTDTFLPQINGVTNTLNRLLAWLNANETDVLVFAPHYGEPDTMPIYDRVTILRFPSVKFLLYPECRLAAPGSIKIQQELMKFQPDLILNMTEFYMGIAGLAAARKLGIPAISNYCTHFPQYLSYYKAEWLKPAAWKYISHFHNRHVLTLCPSKDTQEQLEHEGIKHVALFSRGIDTERFHPEKRSIALRDSLGLGDKMAALYVGRLSVEKDLDILRDSWREIKSRYREQVVLVIAGDGPLAAQLKQEMPAGTIFTGFKRGEELSALYASCDLFVFPSSTETFGNVILEAMASGLPVIGAAAGGVGEIIQPEQDGLVFAAREKEQLTATVERLIQNPELMKQLAAQGLKTAESRTWNLEFERLMSHFKPYTERLPVETGVRQLA